MLQLVDIGLAVDDRPILHDLNLRVLPGEIHAILGMNGTGKSTLASVVMGLSGFSPTSGQVIFQGEDITALPVSSRAKRGITLAWQEPARFEGLTVGEYLELGRHGSRGGGPPPWECLLLVGLPPDRYLQRAVDSTLSGGERKRVELASVLSMGPRLSILDEPDSGIDALSLNHILDAVRILAKNGASVLLITH
ncbi:MAG TPA: ATP-binding cassette domain-containing protein, partial [Candidatus Deferrimicrobiaceae bacterium]|nr:ATP-binding cassette domain-containing protein [Candidatus Deferrimicrobiaceae bacterium]